MQKLKSYSLSIIILLSLIFIYFFLSFIAKNNLKDLPNKIIQAILWPDDTQYAKNYSEKVFNEITNGMTIEDVQKRLGDPLYIIIDSGGRTTKRIDIKNGIKTVSYPDLSVNSNTEITGKDYYYSKPGLKSDNWYVRVITFSKGKVKSISKSFYAD